jgi:predicted alpha/beta-fold hydrolase
VTIRITSADLPDGKTPIANGRLGLARDAAGRPRRAPCIVVLPGLLGDNNVARTRDLSLLLVELGYHALALEQRGHGRTLIQRPDLHYSWGVLEIGDLMAVSEWLEDRPEVTAAGLIGFCWSAQLALLAAWYDNAPAGHPDLSPLLTRWMPKRTGRGHFTAGVIAFSPVPGYEELIADPLARQRYATLENPVLAFMQGTIHQRMVDVNAEPATWSLRDLIRWDIQQADYDNSDAMLDAGYAFLRMVQYKDHPARPKLHYARVPTLLVHAANDPVGTAQHVADLVAPVDNPNVAAVLLPGGGHVGFHPYSRRYFVSLIANFFDPHWGPGSADPPPTPDPTRVR